MSASETPLSDSLTGYEVRLFGGRSERSVRLSDCRSIELRLNAAVEALEDILLNAPEISRYQYQNVSIAIANARKHL